MYSNTRLLSSFTIFTIDYPFNCLSQLFMQHTYTHIPTRKLDQNIQTCQLITTYTYANLIAKVTFFQSSLICHWTTPLMAWLANFMVL